MFADEIIEAFHMLAAGNGVLNFARGFFGQRDRHVSAEDLYFALKEGA